MNMRALAISAILTGVLFGTSSCHAQGMETIYREAQQNTATEFRRQWCRLATDAGVPIGFDQKLRAEAEDALGLEKFRSLMLPVARVNNAYGCFCTQGEERKQFRC